MGRRPAMAAVAVALLVAGVVTVRSTVAPSTATAFETLEMYGVGPMPAVDGGDARARAEVAVDHVALVRAAASLGDDDGGGDAADDLSASDRALVGDLADVEWGGLVDGELLRPSLLVPDVDDSELVALDAAVEGALLALSSDVAEVHRVYANRYEIVGVGDDAPSLVDGLRTVAGVLDVREVGLQRPLVSNDEHVGEQWGLENTGQVVRDRTGAIGTDVGWVEAAAQVDGSGVVVAIIDSGIEFSHPDLAGSQWRNDDEICGNGRDDDGNGYVDDCSGWDFVNGDGTVDDVGVDDQHGTHVAGIVAAATGNRHGVASLAPGVQIMSLKVFEGGSAPDTRITAAIDYAVSNGAHVINLSLGGPGTSPSQLAALDRARETGVLAVIAAGNDGTDNDARPIYPASYDLDNIISVGSIAADGSVSRFSNVGARSVDVFAPGEQILSTLPGDRWGYLSGTSMAAPMATAVAAVTAQSWATTDATTVRRLVLEAVATAPAYDGRAATGGRVFAPYALSGTSHLGELRADVGGVVGLVAGDATIRVRPHLRGAENAQVDLQLALARLVDGDVHAVVDHPLALRQGGTTTETATDAVGMVPLADLDEDQLAELGAGALELDITTRLGAGRYVIGIGARTAAGDALRPIVAFFEVAASGTTEPGDDAGEGSPDDDGIGDGEAGAGGGSGSTGGTTGDPDGRTGDTDGTGTTGDDTGTTSDGSTTTGGGTTTGTTGGPGGGTSGTDGGTTGGGSGGAGSIGDGTAGGGTGGTGGTDGGTAGGGTGGAGGTDGGTAGGGTGGTGGGTAGGGTGGGGTGDPTSAVRPDNGPTGGGTWVTVLGEFEPSRSYYVDIGGTIHRPIIVAPFALGFITEVGPAGTWDVVITGGDEVIVHAGGFTYVPGDGEERNGNGAGRGGISGGAPGRNGGGDRSGGTGRGGDAPDGGDTSAGDDVPEDGADGPGGNDGGGNDGPDTGGDGPGTDDGERIIGLDETTTAGEPVQLDDGMWVDRITGGPLVVLGPGAWVRETCTTDPCTAGSIG